MAKLVASRAGAALGSWFIERERVVIGRAEGAGIRLEDQAVSKQHAAIEMVGNDHILQDLGSANGTSVNGTRVTRHLMRHGDLVEILDFQLRYVDHKSVVGNEGERTMIFHGAEAGQALVLAPGGRAPAAEARVLELAFPEGVLRSAGQGGGREIVLDHALTALGRRGEEYAAIFRRPAGYFIARVEGKPPRVNGKPIADDWQPLAAGDVVQVGVEKLELSLAGRDER
ncbi:MAG TPA: FHA domain-containing protein [Burkholderiales bacterium]|nr:FHA domain-containing protein [Burkholderiales bacterium]